MSNSLAAAKRRRAIPEQAAPPPPVSGRQPTFQTHVQGPSAPAGPSGPQSSIGAGLTLPQVIQVVDQRLSVLENFMRQKISEPTPVVSVNSAPAQVAANVPENLTQVLEEYNGRFDIIADELASLKNMLLTLQSFTMEVNKRLMDERIQLLADDQPNAETVAESS